MQRRIHVALVGVLLLLVTHCQAVDENYVVTFQVVDSNGNPIEGADLSTGFGNNILKPEDSVFDPRGDSTVTDANGKAEIIFEDHTDQFGVLGYTADRKLGRCVLVERQDEGTTIEIVFKPISIVSARQICSEVKQVLSWTNTAIMLDGSRLHVVNGVSNVGEVEFPLPQGKWSYMMYGTNIKPVRKKFTVGGAGEAVDLGTVDFEPTAMAKLIGKPAPKLDFVDARGVESDFQLSDLKGKWVLIEFWGYW